MSALTRYFVSGSAIALMLGLGVSGAIAQPMNQPLKQDSMMNEATVQVPATVEQVYDSGNVRVQLEDESYRTIPLSDLDIERLDLEPGTEVMLTLEDDRVIAVSNDDAVATINIADADDVSNPSDTEADLAATDDTDDTTELGTDTEITDTEVTTRRTVEEERRVEPIQTETTAQEPVVEEEPTEVQQGETVRGLW
ncbi:MAG: hypothetical protein ACFE0J_05595 [Elainellaceae cyanobacterium]